MQPTMENYYNGNSNSNTNGYPRLYNEYVNQPSLLSAANANQLYYPTMASMFPTSTTGGNNNQSTASLLQQVSFRISPLTFMTAGMGIQ